MTAAAQSPPCPLSVPAPHAGPTKATGSVRTRPPVSHNYPVSRERRTPPTTSLLGPTQATRRYHGGFPRHIQEILDCPLMTLALLVQIGQTAAEILRHLVCLRSLPNVPSILTVACCLPVRQSRGICARRFQWLTSLVRGVNLRGGLNGPCPIVRPRHRPALASRLSLRVSSSARTWCCALRTPFVVAARIEAISTQ